MILVLLLQNADAKRKAALQVTAPQITKRLITQLALAYAHHQADLAGFGALVPAARSVGYGVGLAFALFAMEMSSSLFTYQAQQRASVIGFQMRASVSRGICAEVTGLTRN